MNDKAVNEKEEPFWPYGLVLAVMFVLLFAWLREGLFYLIGFFIVLYTTIGIVSILNKKK